MIKLLDGFSCSTATSKLFNTCSTWTLLFNHFTNWWWNPIKLLGTLIQLYLIQLWSKYNCCMCVFKMSNKEERQSSRQRDTAGKRCKRKNSFSWRDVWKQQARKTTISVKDLEEGLEGGKNKSIIKDYKWVDLKGKGVNFGNFSTLQSKPKRT